MLDFAASLRLLSGGWLFVALDHDREMRDERGNRN